MPRPAGLARLFYRFPPAGKGLAGHAGISDLFGKAQAIYRELCRELDDVPLTGGGSDGNFTAALGIPTLDGLGADGKGAHAAYEQIYFSSLMPRTYLCARLLETLD
jgi:glutamate carboxypeptidase